MCFLGNEEDQNTLDDFDDGKLFFFLRKKKNTFGVWWGRVEDTVSYNNAYFSAIRLHVFQLLDLILRFD